MQEQSTRIDGEQQQSTKKVFLLTGKPRTGKSTLIKKLINELGSETCGGFYTEEITNSINERIGFRCVSVDGESVEIAHVESPSETRIGRYGINNEEFEKFALRFLQEAMTVKKIIVIDEIGFIQMLSASFHRKVQEIINDNRIVLGTVPLDSHPEIDKIKLIKGVQLESINESTRDMIIEFLVKDMLKAIDSSTL
jgi:Predicted nucleotide kinase